MTEPLTMRQLRRFRFPALKLRELTLDDVLLQKARSLESERQGPTTPTCSLGDLDRLPLEILREILIDVDLLSLYTVRRVNRRAMHVVDHLPQRRSIITHCAVALRGIFAIGISSLITCRDLYRALRTPNCRDCNDFGGYIYLFTCRRVCFVCFTNNIQYLPLNEREAQQVFGLPRGTVRSLPFRMKSMPGQYANTHSSFSKPLTLFDYEMALGAGIAFHGSDVNMRRRNLEIARAEAASRRKRTAESESESASESASASTPGRGPAMPPPPPLLLVGDADSKASNPRRFMAIVRAPWINPFNQAEHGFYCDGCAGEHNQRPFCHRRMYLADSYDDHIRQCGQIVPETGLHVGRDGTWTLKARGPNVPLPFGLEHATNLIYCHPYGNQE